MCLAVFALDVHPRYWLVLAANRDEYYLRPARPAVMWDEELAAGQDLQSGGTWLGVSLAGRIAFLTNVRDGGPADEAAPTRGQLVVDFLRGENAFLDRLHREGRRYNGFNIVFGDRHGLSYYTNRGESEGTLAAGVHGLSNHHLGTPWPKVARATEALEAALERDDLVEAAFDLLMDRTVPPDAALPDTGVGIALERVLSPAFVEAPGYGTRSSTVVLMGHDGEVRFEERTHGSGEEPRVVLRFEVAG